MNSCNNFSNFVSDPSHVDWMKLFLDRTNEQAKNIETNLSGAETVLKEVQLTLKTSKLLYQLFEQVLFLIVC